MEMMGKTIFRTQCESRAYAILLTTTEQQEFLRNQEKLACALTMTVEI